MAIITLTTDFGTSDHYVAVLKALILRSNPAQVIVDINHQIRPFDITHGAVTLKHMYHEFPKGTIHVIGINAEPEINFNNPEESMMPCIIEHDGHYFIGNDNGIFSLIFNGKQPDEIYEISELSSPDLLVFPTKTILIPTALKIIEGIPLEEIGTKKNQVRRALSISPVIENHSIKGIVVHVDHYGNLITNISKDEFKRVGAKFNFKIRFRTGQYIIDEISHGYNEVPQGEKLALFNDFGYLEIAINKGVIGNGGGASGLFGMKINDPITIEFFPPGSINNLESLF